MSTPLSNQVPQLITKGQLVKRLGVSRWTLTRWIEARIFTVQPIVIGGRPFYSEPEVLAFLDAHRKGSEASD